MITSNCNLVHIFLGATDGEKEDRNGCEINEAAANSFLTESKQWERTLVLSEVKHITK